MDPQPPADPRDEWDLPAPGQLDHVARLDAVTTRILADNPSHMTLDGTNTHVVAPPGAGVALVVDPGPDDPTHHAAVQDVLDEHDAQPVAVVVTHHHLDHAEAAASWARGWQVPVVARDREVAGTAGRTVVDGDRVDLPGLRVDVIATPGHTADHLAFRLGTGALLTGDHVLGRGTSVVSHPDGNLAAYLDSLRRVVRVHADVLFPGHGPVLGEDPDAVLRHHLLHREYRLEQISAVLGAAPATPRGIVETIYADHDPAVWPAAEASTRAALEYLSDQGRVAWDGDIAELRG